VVVLSNNDGCAIARSEQAKAMGIKMGQPWFEIRGLRERGLVALSANFALYGDMSDRMMSIAAGLGPEQEIYSIDECFVGLENMPGDLLDRARRVRERIWRWTGLPTCVGIGQTKTLAKLANHIAKAARRKPGSYPVELAGVCDLSACDDARRQALLAQTPVGEVWGIGRRLGPALQTAGADTAAAFLELPESLVRARWGVTLARTWRELQGDSCLGLEEVAPSKREIACTRSFGAPVMEPAPLREAIGTFVARAARTLRQQAGIAGGIMVFIRTSPFRPGPQYSRGAVLGLPQPTDDTATLIRAAMTVFQSLYRPGYAYMKAGVMLVELAEAANRQGTLDWGGEDGPATALLPETREGLMPVVDALNVRFGSGTVQWAASGSPQRPAPWAMRQTLRTPAYTTRWEDLPSAWAG